MAENEGGQTPVGGEPPESTSMNTDSSEGDIREESLLTPEEQATLSPAEQRALARKRLAERMRATIPDEQRRMTRRAGAQPVEPPVPSAPQASTLPPQAEPPLPSAGPESLKPPGVSPIPPATPGPAAPPTIPSTPVSPHPAPAAPSAPHPTAPLSPETTEGPPREKRQASPDPTRMAPPRKRPPRGRDRPVPQAIPAVLARPTNLPTRAREPSKVHPLGVAGLIVIATAVAYFFADIWGVVFVPLLLILLWRKVDSRELLGITAVVVASVPLIMVIQGIDLGGNIDSSYALKQMLAHAVAGISIGLLAIACVVAAVDWRYRVLPLDPAGDPNDEPVLVSFLPSRKGIEARVVAKARPIKEESLRS